MNETQTRALAILTDIWKLSTDVRLGQLMAHLGFLGENYANKGLGYIEDEELLAVMIRHREELANRSAKVGAKN